MDTYDRYKKFKEELLKDIEEQGIKKRNNIEVAVKKYKPFSAPPQYAGKEIARDLEKYIGLIPFTIDNDDKYEKYLIDAKNIMFNNNFKPSKTPKCSPINKNSVPRDHKLLVVYYNPIPEKFNTGTPGFALINQKKYKRFKCNQNKFNRNKFNRNKFFGGKKTRRRNKKKSKKKRTKKKRTKKKRRRKKR